MASSSPTSWSPRRSTGGEAALWVSMLLLAGAATIAWLSTRQQPSIPMVLTVVAAAILIALAVATYLLSASYRSLVYSLGDRGLEIPWFGETALVPYAAIDGIYTGQRLVGSSQPGGLVWPGVYVGMGRARGTGRLRFFTTSQDPADLTLVTAGGAGFVVSARDPQAFRSALIQRVQQVAEDAEVEACDVLPPTRAPWTLVRDRWAPWALALSVVLLLAMLSLVALRFEGLPEPVPLHFDASGVPNETGSRWDLFRLPIGGLLVLLVNWMLSVWLHARESYLARVLWMGAVAIQAILLVAVVRLLQ